MDEHQAYEPLPLETAQDAPGPAVMVGLAVIGLALVAVLAVIF
jgi:hypothetical protein